MKDAIAGQYLMLDYIITIGISQIVEIFIKHFLRH